ncbi:alpha/beta fold hydrolase [Pontibacter burrus]|uniref:Alpha/beta hydrolase n=1 Tax=Pontibacter burrus TaxID=2704466 RepID=A0A6B3LSH7_9BACT|nr:alpha/beta fold hydrolase [Pontibacter burrus]NEM96444.1 alpha/beta hydrolase [Pontibacter burrus]
MENLLLLHGALGAATMLEPLKKTLSGSYNVFTLDFAGHGGTAFAAEPFSIKLFAANVLDFLEREQLQQVHIFGYSMGGYVALYLAAEYPERIKSVFTLATKFAWSAEAAAKEVKLLDPEKIKAKVPHFAATLADRHAPNNWEEVMQQTVGLMLGLGQEPLLTPSTLANIQQPVQVSVGDQDNMVTIEETTEAYRHLPNARLLVLPATRHPLETININRLQHEINLFITSLPVL